MSQPVGVARVKDRAVSRIDHDRTDMPRQVAGNRASLRRQREPEGGQDES